MSNEAYKCPVCGKSIGGDILRQILERSGKQEFDGWTYNPKETALRGRVTHRHPAMKPPMNGAVVCEVA